MEQKDQVSYKGYQIMVMSFQLIRSGQWEFKVIIFGKGGYFSKHFLSPIHSKPKRKRFRAVLSMENKLSMEKLRAVR